MLKSIWTQTFPPKPTFKEDQVPPGSQVGKVFIITGANQGIGLELVKMLYPTGATIYLAGRSQDRVNQAIKDVASSASPVPSTPAKLRYLHLDLSDLTTIKPAATEFAKQEDRLDILWNNAGIGGQPVGTTTKQNIEGHIGINCVAPLLFTTLLLPQLQNAAQSSSPGTVRIIWTSSLTIEQFAPSGGVDFTSINQPATTNFMRDYPISKAGNYFLANEAAARWGAHNISSICMNPGQLHTGIWKEQSWLMMAMLKPILYEPKMGAYSMLFAGVSKEVGNAAYVFPFGRVGSMARGDLAKALGDGKGREFWEWCEGKHKEFE